MSAATLSLRTTPSTNGYYIAFATGEVGRIRFDGPTGGNVR
jgi:hypothetical protein